MHNYIALGPIGIEFQGGHRVIFIWHIYKLDKEVVIYGGRESKVEGDDGLLSSVETERDIERIHYDGRIVVEFRNGFLIY